MNDEQEKQVLAISAKVITLLQEETTDRSLTLTVLASMLSSFLTVNNASDELLTSVTKRIIEVVRNGRKEA